MDQGSKLAMNDMEIESKRRLFQFNLQVLLLIFVIVAMALGWWRTHDQLAQAQAQIEAIHRAEELHANAPRAIAGSPRVLPASKIQTPAEFIAALRVIQDLYKFNDDTADPFVKTPVADETIPALIDLLKDPDSQIRTKALSTLGKIKRRPEVIVPAMIPMLNDVHSNVRWHAAFALGQFQAEAKSSIPALMLQFNDDTSPIAAFSADMIRQIDNTIETEPRLAQLLANPLKENRERAVSALSSLATPAALQALIAYYRTVDDPKLRDRLASTIGHLDKKINAKSAP